MSEGQSTTSGKKVSAILGFLLLVSLAGNAFLGSMFWQLRQEVVQLREDPQMMAQQELEQVLAEVSQIISLPEGVIPILATVNNAEEIRERQPFFANAENGDKLLLYSNAPLEEDRKAYLYRPSTRQLINVAPVNLGGQIQAQEDSFTIAIRNGTNQNDLGAQMESLMERIFPNATVSEVGNAARNDYSQSVLVQVDGNDEVVGKVANLFNVPIQSLPEGEVAPTGVDMLLILGFTGEELEAEVQEQTETQAPAATPAGEPEAVETEVVE